MSLISCATMVKPEREETNVPPVSKLDQDCRDVQVIADVLKRPDQLGEIWLGIDKHFYSRGAFNLIQLVLYILQQTGPANVFLSTYSIATESISTLIRKKEEGVITYIRFLIDNRVRSISPKPFDYLITSFPDSYRCCALHAKVALIWNERYKISVVGSQNATHNPKLERGIVHTDPAVWAFDLNVLNDEFERGNT